MSVSVEGNNEIMFMTGSRFIFRFYSTSEKSHFYFILMLYVVRMKSSTHYYSYYERYYEINEDILRVLTNSVASYPATGR